MSASGVRRSFRLGPVLLAAILGGMLPACSDDDGASQPGCPSGLIIGRVAGASGKAGTMVIADQVPRHGSYESNASYRTETVDSTGAFSIAVPPGVYRLRVPETRLDWGENWWWSAHRRQAQEPYPVSDASWADTIHVEQGGIARADIFFGDLTVDLVLPEIGGLRSFFMAAYALYPWFEDGESVSWPAEVTTGLDLKARLVLHDLPANVYRLRLRVRSGDSILLPGPPGEPEWVTVGPMENVTRTYDLTGSLGRISGRVHGAWQELGWSPPEVVVYGADSVHAITSVEVDSEGRFDFLILHPGPVRVAVRQWQDEPRWFGGSRWEEARVFQVDPGGTVSGIDIADNGLELTLNGLDISTSHEFTVLLVNQEHRNLYRRVLATGAGPVRITNLPAGPVWLRLEPRVAFSEGWLPQWYNGADRIEDAQPIEIPDGGGIVRASVNLVQGGTLSGRILIRDPFGQLSWGSYAALCIARADRPDSVVRAGRADHTGGFGIRGLPDGDYRVGLITTTDVLSDTIRIWAPDTQDWDAAEVFSIRDHQEVTGVRITGHTFPWAP